MKLIFTKAFVRPHVRKHPTTGRPVSVSGYHNSKPHSPLPSKLPPFDEEEWIGVQPDRTLARRLPKSRSNQPWIGVDLDKVLASHEPGSGLTAIGYPIPKMIARVRRWIRKGERIKIFTARASDQSQVPLIQAWLKKHGLPKLEVTNIKDPLMKLLLDDKAFHVRPNRGVIVW